MRVAVLGLWHLGSVTAACMANAGHDVIGWDPDNETVAQLRAGHAPVAEPGLDNLLARMLAGGRLRFTSSSREAVSHADVVWIAFDTPVDEEDRADVEAVFERVRVVLPEIADNALVISSSQLPVGSIAHLEREFAALGTGRRVRFACLPENLRLGKALDRFMKPDRIVAGIRRDGDRETIVALFAAIADRLVWMSVESAEMTKHAINAFLATSVTFINEIAALCEMVGADAKDVERGLKSDQRIGERAYLSPGAAFAGGTLARDVVLLGHKAMDLDLDLALMRSVLQSNRGHAQWTYRTLAAMLAPLAARRVAVLGLTYTPGTDTLRRSLSVELCRRLAAEGATVTAFDPAIAAIPESMAGIITLAPTALAAVTDADAVVVATEWPILRQIGADDLVEAVARPLVIDAGRFLAATLGADPRVRYVAVGTPRP